jgi:hypothetical protein
LGLSPELDPEAEHPEALLVITPQDNYFDSYHISDEVISQFENLKWQGIPNRLSSSHREWQIIASISEAVIRLPNQEISYAKHTDKFQVEEVTVNNGEDEPTLRELVRRRRSAVAFDGRTPMDSGTFFKILQGTLDDPQRILLQTLP